MISEAAFTSSGVGRCSLVSVCVNCPHPIPQVCCSLVALWFHRGGGAVRPVFSLDALRCRIRLLTYSQHVLQTLKGRLLPIAVNRVVGVSN
ncbi:hypothetical protein J4Q44_G00208470 [Coregonus suidteri]|uniref:Uncharacterized protein n=1 Tax=Coregonus suidteri TaxID=861788 RepID=A0AAN8LHA2_9TELE